MVKDNKKGLSRFFYIDGKIFFKKVPIQGINLYFIYDVSLTSLLNKNFTGKIKPIAIISESEKTDYKIWMLDESKDYKKLVKKFTIEFL